jgi:hypothetical protein
MQPIPDTASEAERTTLLAQVPRAPQRVKPACCGPLLHHNGPCRSLALNHPPLQRRAARRDRRRAELMVSIADADLARGAPPAATSSWRVEPELAGDLVAVWEVCMVSALLHRRRRAGLPWNLDVVTTLSSWRL